MDRWTLVGLGLLVAWAVPTFAFAPAPGWVHLLLTAGVFLVIYGAVARGTSRPGPDRAASGSDRS